MNPFMIKSYLGANQKKQKEAADAAAADGEAPPADAPPPPPPPAEKPLKERPDVPRVIAYSDSSDDEAEVARRARRLGAKEVRGKSV